MLSSELLAKYQLRTCGSLFSGGGGWEMGATLAGLTPVFGVECDPEELEISMEVADAYELNTGATAVRVDVREYETVIQHILDILCRAALTTVDLLFMSPPCQQTSRGRRKSLPKRADADVGIFVLEYVRVLMPKLILLENVPDYQKTEYFQKIVTGLKELGYNLSYQIINCADYGVPQTRERLILAATRVDMPQYVWPVSTHHNGPHTVTLWSEELLPWRGWYETLEHILHTFPEDKFAKWQEARLPEYLTDKRGFLLTGNSSEAVSRPANRPANTVVASLGTRGMSPRCFLVGGSNTNFKQAAPGRSVYFEDEPFPTIPASRSFAPRAFVASQQATGERDANGSRKALVRSDYAPMFTVLANSHPVRAYLEQGKVVRLTIEALALLQTFPTCYKLPTRKIVAHRIVGDAVPPKISEIFVTAYAKLLNQTLAEISATNQLQAVS